MPIGYRDSSAAYTNSGTSLGITIPATVQVDDVIIVAAGLSNVTLGDPSISGGGAGGTWTAYGPIDDVALRTRIWKRVAVAGDAGATATVSWTTSGKMALLCWAGSGANITDPFDQTPATTVESGTATTHTCPGLTPAGVGCWIVEVCFDRGTADTAISAPGGRTERAEQLGSGAGAPSGIVADSNGAVTAGAASGATTYTFDQSASNAVGWSVAVAEQPAPLGRARVRPPAAAVRAATW